MTDAGIVLFPFVDDTAFVACLVNKSTRCGLAKSRKLKTIDVVDDESEENWKVRWV